MLQPTDRFSSSAIRDLLDHSRRPGVISLAGGLPASERLPVERIDRAWSSVIDAHGAAAFQYGPTIGEPELIEALATTEQVDPKSLVITSGSQQALDLVASVLESPSGASNLAAIEHPGYVGALQILRSRRYELMPIPVDQDGLAVDVLANELARGARPTLCYVNPSFQNPTGASLPVERGRALIDLAERYGFVVVSDDPYAELHLDGDRSSPLPDSDRLVRLGSMSKTLSPGLRIGWMDATDPLRSTAVLAKQAADLHTSTMNQLLAASILADGRWWRAHCEALRTSYRDRRAALRRAIDTRMPEITIRPQGGGFFLWLPLDGNADSLACAANALDNGVAVVPGDAFSADSRETVSAIRLSYSNTPIDGFDEAIARLSASLSHDRSR